MRIKHLSDVEIQSLLKHSGKVCSSQEQTTPEIQKRIHLANCYLCQEQMELYQSLDIEIKLSERFSLPRDFARRVTISLPPFIASRRNAIKQMVFCWSAASLLMLGWLLTRVDWLPFFLNLFDISMDIQGRFSILIDSTGGLLNQFDIPSGLIFTMYSLFEFSNDIISSLTESIIASGSIVSVVMGAALMLATVELITNTLHTRLRIDK